MKRASPLLIVLPALCALIACAHGTGSRTQTVLPKLRKGCAGTHLDLKWMAAQSSRCKSASDAPPRGRLVEFLEPRVITLEAGERGTVDYVIHNPTAEPVPLVLPALSCHKNTLRLSVLTSDDKRMRQSCVGGGGCSMPDARVTIAPGGDARFRLEVRADRQGSFWRADKSCALHPTELLPAGTYPFRLSTSLLGKSTKLTGALHVIGKQTP